MENEQGDAAFMRVSKLRLERFRSYREQTVELACMNVLIGPNGAGKSNVIDALWLLHVGYEAADIGEAANIRGGVTQLAWKGREASDVVIDLDVDGGDTLFNWKTILRRGRFQSGIPDHVEEHLWARRATSAPTVLLKNEKGKGWYYRSQVEERFQLPSASSLALPAACAREGFEGRPLGEFVRRWGFYDPVPTWMKGRGHAEPVPYLRRTGENLARRVWTLREEKRTVFDRWRHVVKDILGQDVDVDVREVEGETFLTMKVGGLVFPVHQPDFASGSLRLMALLLVLVDVESHSLLAIEEPENYVHPGALADLVGMIRTASERIQVILTTHSPLVLDRIEDPGAVLLVRQHHGSSFIEPEPKPEVVLDVLKKSDLRLGEYHQSRGFGVPSN